MLGRGFLAHRERSGPAGRPDSKLAAPGIRAGSLEPRLRPVAEAAPGACLECAQQLGESGVPPGVLGEVPADAGQEAVPAEVGKKLLEYCRAFGVADPVEVRLRLAQRWHTR